MYYYIMTKSDLVTALTEKQSLLQKHDVELYAGTNDRCSSTRSTD